MTLSGCRIDTGCRVEIMSEANRHYTWICVRDTLTYCMYKLLLVHFDANTIQSILEILVHFKFQICRLLVIVQPHQSMVAMISRFRQCIIFISFIYWEFRSKIRSVPTEMHWQNPLISWQPYFGESIFYLGKYFSEHCVCLCQSGQMRAFHWAPLGLPPEDTWGCTDRHGGGERR